MESKLLEGAGGKLADRLTGIGWWPALAFWIGGFIALYTHDQTDIWRLGLLGILPGLLPGAGGAGPIPLPELKQLVSDEGLALLIGALLLVGASANVVAHFALPTLRLAEGYWPIAIRSRLTAGLRVKLNHYEECRSLLRVKLDENGGTPEERKQYDRVDAWLRRVPTEPEDILPTRLGNVLRSAELRVHTKYRLNSFLCWPRLWLVLPKDVKEDISEARSQLNGSALSILWGFFFCIWTVWAWWPLLIGVIVVVASYLRTLDNGVVYAELFESAFDDYRLLLYAALRWPLPTNPEQELEFGAEVSDYLWGGFDTPHPYFRDMSRRPGGD